MKEEDKKAKIQILADKLMSLLPLVDSFMGSLTDEDYELLKETRALYFISNFFSF